MRSAHKKGRVCRLILILALLVLICLKVDLLLLHGFLNGPVVLLGLFLECGMVLGLWIRPSRLTAAILVAFFLLATLHSLLWPSFDCGCLGRFSQDQLLLVFSASALGLMSLLYLRSFDRQCVAADG